MSAWTDDRHKAVRSWLNAVGLDPWTVAPTSDLSDALDEIERLQCLLEGKTP